MGFECSFERSKRFPKGITPEQLAKVSSYMYWDKQKSLKENYPTFEDYRRTYREEKDCTLPDQELIDFYSREENQYDSEFFEDQKEISKTIQYWCSSGRIFDDLMREKLGGNNYEEILPQEVSESKIKEILIALREKLDDEYKLEPVMVRRAFKEEGDPEEPTFVSIPCGGVEAEFEDQSLRRIYSNDWEWTELYASKHCFDFESYETLRSLEKTLIDILLTTDFEKEIITYHSGW